MHPSLEGTLKSVPQDILKTLDTRDDKHQYAIKFCKVCKADKVHRFGKPMNDAELGTCECEWELTREDIEARASQ